MWVFFELLVLTVLSVSHLVAFIRVYYFSHPIGTHHPCYRKEPGGWPMTPHPLQKFYFLTGPIHWLIFSTVRIILPLSRPPIRQKKIFRLTLFCFNDFFHYKSHPTRPPHIYNAGISDIFPMEYHLNILFTSMGFSHPDDSKQYFSSLGVSMECWGPFGSF